MEKRYIDINEAKLEDLDDTVEIAFKRNKGSNIYGRSFTGNSLGILEALLLMITEVTRDMGFSKEQGAKFVAKEYKDYYDDIKSNK